jgi:hypothetical protein
MNKIEYIYFYKNRAFIKIGIIINTGSEIVKMLLQEQIKWLGM